MEKKKALILGMLHQCLRVRKASMLLTCCQWWSLERLHYASEKSCQQGGLIMSKLLA